MGKRGECCRCLLVGDVLLMMVIIIIYTSVDIYLSNYDAQWWEMDEGVR